MKFINKFVALFLLLAAPAYAADDAPFVWPDAYSLSIKTTSKSGEFEPFVNIYYKDGLKVRNQTKSGAEIFRYDQHKRISVDTAGKISESKLIDDAPASNFFPANAKWEGLGQYTLGDKRMNRYKVTGGEEELFVWLSGDNKIPLGVETPTNKIEFFNYSPARPEAKLFDFPTK